MEFQPREGCRDYLSNYSYQERGLFEVEIPNGLAVHGFIRADQVKSLDWRARRAVFWCIMPNETVAAASNIVQAIIWGN